ncbi:MAG TPA: glycosyltransferase [Candidatus Wunengus sp. YC60]|uniref:glycosyltransferase n=1 Tax=Candidatus Wunengus sp. YC60 TaxID=3367697 RepID=UPI004024CBBF
MSFSLLKNLKSKSIAYRQSLYAWIDYRKYASSLHSFYKIAEKLPEQKNGSLLIVSGRGMNVLLAQLWPVFSLAVRVHGYRGLVLTTHTQQHLNRYFWLLGIEPIFLDDLIKVAPADLPVELSHQIQEATTFEAIKNLSYKETPIGQIALSTYSRYQGTGVIDLNNPTVLKFVREWIEQIYKAMQVAEMVYKQYNVQYLFFAEVFMEEYGAFYYTALLNDLNIIRFAGTVRDNAFILQHMTKSNDRCHHASLSPTSWKKVKAMPLTPKIEAELEQNFLDRYGDKWHRSKRNHPNTRIMPVEEARRILNIAEGRKIAVIYSHILYDTLFFFGTDLFNDYADWLVETVRVACQNPAVDWLVKVHPSNLWRGELGTLLKGKYEEERLLQNEFGELPQHVRIVSADTKINPYTWFQLSDYGITVRGTAGLEMAALGKTVITAGTGRYEGNGFTVDPRDKDEYLDILKKLPDIPPLSQEQVRLAKRYAYAIFVLKPFTLKCMKPTFRTGVREVRASDDIVQLGVQFDTNGHTLPPDLQKVSKWVLEKDNHDLLPEWIA